MICFIVPPHILTSIQNYGSEQQRKWATSTIEISKTIRDKRKAFIPNLSRKEPAVAKAMAGNGENREIYTASNSTNLPGIEERKENQSPINDTAANQAYDGTGATFTLYKSIYQRNSIDNNGMSIISTVHYGIEYDNAFWDGQQMVYGDGDGEIFSLFTKPIDVTGHELTHGVTQYTANLNYVDQSGALNESFSDVFGSLVKQQVLSQTADKADWLIGEGIFTNKVNGKALRSMASPGTAYNDPVLGKDPQPGDMSNFVETTDDNGGVHINSGIPNHAFYLAAIAIGGYAWETVGKIWYTTLTQKLKSNANFADCANATIETAGELFTNKEQEAVTTAWKKVGVI